jgi:light-regulated signal transduction histidine kinase (bacteriophytochrome)
LPDEERQLAKETGRYESENWRRKKNGELFWAFVVLTRVLDEEGNHIGFIKVTQDQTDKKKYLEQLLKSNSSLEEFAYAASHDLQAPLRKISVFVDRLKNQLLEQLNDQQQELFNRVRKSTDRMIGLIENLLEFSYVSKGTGKTSEIDLNQQVINVLEDLELDLLEKRAKLRVKTLPKVRGNTLQFQQLFQNLISNSIKYTKPGVVPVIEISSYEVTGYQAKENLPVEAADKPYHLIQLKDNGIGFKQEYANDIFKVFTRLHANSEYSGTGVGLSIVQKVVENHNGYVWAESKPGEGAIFKILLPVSS